MTMINVVINPIVFAAFPNFMYPFNCVLENSDVVYGVIIHKCKTRWKQYVISAMDKPSYPKNIVIVSITNPQLLKKGTLWVQKYILSRR